MMLLALCSITVQTGFRLECCFPHIPNLGGGGEQKDIVTIIVRLFPPKADCKSLVRTESLYGMCNTLLPVAASARALEEK